MSKKSVIGRVMSECKKSVIGRVMSESRLNAFALFETEMKGKGECVFGNAFR